MTSPRVFLLPNDSSNFTIISLPHPRTEFPARFLLHPETGLHEITKITPPSATPRSWLLANPKPPTTETTGTPDAEKPTEKNNDKSSDWLGNGQTIQDGHLYISTPFDPVFLLLPHLFPKPTPDAPKRHFLPLDDILDELTTTDDDDAEDTADKPHWEAALKVGSPTRRQVEARVRAVCGSVDVGGDMAYKPDSDKLLALLKQKCEDMARGGLPKSMEDAFVVRPLARPITEGSQQEGETTEETTTIVVGRQNGGDGEDDAAAEMLPTPPDSQRTVPAGLPPASEDVKHLLRLRVASQFLAGTYLPVHIATALVTHLSAVHDFSPLDTYLAELKRLRTEAVSLRSADFSLKRGHDDDGGDTGAKRRKKEEAEEAEKKKKKNISKAVRDLGKVSTRGMAKMTSFFKKKEA